VPSSLSRVSPWSAGDQPTRTAKLNEGVEVKPSGTTTTVERYGERMVRGQACTGAGCGPPVVQRFAAKPAAQPAHDSEAALDPSAVSGTPEPAGHAADVSGAWCSMRNDVVGDHLLRWAEDLVDLSRRNRLLYFRHYKSGSLRFAQDPSHVEAKLGRGWYFFLPPNPPDDPDEPFDQGEPKDNELVVDMSPPRYGPMIERSLKNIMKKGDSMFLDAGLWIVYMGLGMLRWRDDDDTVVSSPLLLVPVQILLDGRNRRWRLKRSEDGEAVLNPALAVKFERDFGIELPTLDQLDVPDFYHVAETVREKAAGLKATVEEETVLTTFFFHKEVIYRDLLQNAATIARHPLVRLLAKGPDSEEARDLHFTAVPGDQLDRAHPPEDMACILDADGTQRRCLVAARQGHSFVMDGPPGTGKSQTIGNMIAQFLVDGKTVLFVSEKAAALEVVHNRLSERELHRFALALHSRTASRKEVAQELGRALLERVQADVRLDPTGRDRLVRSRKRLSEYATAINVVRAPLGWSLHRAIGRVSQIRGSDDMPVPSVDTRRLDTRSFSHLRTCAERLSRSWGPVSRDDFLWRDLKNPTSGAAHQAHLRILVTDCRNRHSRLEALAADVCDRLALPLVETPEATARLVALLDLVERRHPIDPTWLVAREAEFRRIVTGSARLSHLLKRRQDLEQRLSRTAEDWRPHPESLARSLSERLDEIHRAMSTLALTTADRTHSADVMTGMLEKARQAEETVGELTDAAEYLTRAFGVTDSPTLGLLSRLAEITQLIGSTAPPEPTWLNPGTARRLTEAIRLLGGSLSGYRTSREQLADVFTEDVLDLDLRALRARFHEVHTGLRKLRGGYRDDKRLLARVTVAGRFTKDTLARLGDAVAWQEHATDLRKAERLYAELIGPRYWPDRDSADMDRIEQASEVAAKARNLAQGDVTASHLTKWISWEAEDDSDLPVIGRGALERLETLHGLAEDLGIETRILRSLSSDVAQRLASTRRVIETAVALLREVDSITDQPATLRSARGFLRCWLEYHGADREVSEAAQQVNAPLGRVIDGLDFVRIEAATAWAQELRTHLGGPIPHRAAESLLTAAITSGDLRDHSANFHKAVRELTAVFNQGHGDVLQSELASLSFESGHELLNHLYNTVNDVVEWESFTRNRRTLEEAGWKPVVEECIKRRVPNHEVAALIERSILQRWIDQQLDDDEASSNPSLQPRRARDRDALQEEFRQLDKDLVAHTAAQVINSCSERIPRSALGQEGIILQQAQLKKRHKPVRWLLSEAGEAAQRIKPCFMMSPLSISQFLPPDLRFDVVIFDEASQVREADAICSIARGKQLIVVGDQKQLPPTNFFQQVTDIDEDDSLGILDFESILDRCKGQGLRSLPLLWHYRSRHESLITYSNRSFYDGRLHTFPGAVADSPDLGVELIRVDGVYERGGTRQNRIEAETVVDRVLHHRRRHPHLTIGVVTLSSAQQSAIEFAVERRARREPELRDLRAHDRLGGFFVKNLENVQGDERDLIILSIGYGPDENGKLTMNFGPMNNEGGERRLNVAVTRARHRVEVICSFAPGRIRTNNPTIKHLARYLDYAERGVPALALDLQDSQGDAESPFEEEVLRSLQAMGYDVTPQVGVAGYRIDIGVRHPSEPGRFVLGVECDGAAYHSSKDARSRDRLRQQVLEGLGWRVHRIWSTAWYADRHGEERSLKHAIEHALRADGQTEPSQATEAPSEVAFEVDGRDFDGLPDWVHSYTEPELARVKSGSDFETSTYFISTQIKQVVEASGPIHEDRVLEIIKRSWNIGRVGTRIRKTFSQAVLLLVNRRKLTVSGRFLSLPGCEIRVRAPMAHTGQETADGPPANIRPVAHIPPAEIYLAILNLLRDAGGTAQQPMLVKRLAGLFGWRRVGSRIGRALDRAIDQLIDTGDVTEEADGWLRSQR